jgi:hypothetical protein
MPSKLLRGEVVVGVRKEKESMSRAKESESVGNGYLSVPLSKDASETVLYISPRAYLKSMLAIAWSAFRYPFSTTMIDLSTGNVVAWEVEGEGPPHV